MIAAAAVCLCLLTVAPNAASQPAPAPSPSIEIAATLHSTSKTPLPRIVRVNEIYQPPQSYQGTCQTVTITAVNGSVLTFRPKLKYSHFAPGVSTGIDGVTMPMVRAVYCTLTDHSCSAAPLRLPDLLLRLTLMDPGAGCRGRLDQQEHLGHIHAGGAAQPAAGRARHHLRDKSQAGDCGCRVQLPGTAGHARQVGPDPNLPLPRLH